MFEGGASTSGDGESPVGGSLRRARPLVSGGPVSVDLFLADDCDHAQALRDLDLIAGQVEAARAAVMVSAAATGVPGVDGHRTPHAWARATVDCSIHTSREWYRRGHLLDAVPEFATALAEGRLTVDHVDELTRAHANPRCGYLLPEFAESFLAAARSLRHDEFVDVVTKWIDLADQDGPDPGHEERRSFRLRKKSDGSSDPIGHLTPEMTAAFESIFSVFLDAQRLQDLDEAKAAGDPDLLPRTEGQRGADALMAMVLQSAAMPPGARKPKPLTRLVVTWAQAQAALVGWDPANPVSMTDQMCRTIDGQTVTPIQALAAMLEGEVQVLILDAMKVPFAMGAPGTLYGPKAREAILSLSPTCIWPGCSCPASHCDIDHMHPRHQGGSTSLANAAPLCPFHNRWRFRHSYAVTRDASGVWHVWRPDGTEVAGRPPP
jgi:hypothetical protein